MSGNDGVISFDLVHGRGQSVDVARFFRMVTPHALSTDQTLIDTISPGVGKIHDLSVSKTLKLSRFRTLGTLDLIARDIVEVGAIGRKLSGLAERPQSINLVSPLSLPYFYLDIRSLTQHPKVHTYPDIYRRNLPSALWLRRGLKTTKTLLRTHKKQVLSLAVTALMVSMPMLFYVKFSLENGYQKLLSLPLAHSFEEVRKTVASARSDFERANFVFFPFSLVPFGPLGLADTALTSGLLVSRSLSTILDTLPKGASGSIMLPKSDTRTPEFRKEAEDIFPLARFGIDLPTDWLHEHMSDFQSVFADLSRTASLLTAEGTGSAIQNKMYTVGDLLSRLTDGLGWSLDHETALLDFLGHHEPVRYIVFNQNRDEIRANGGFPGSVISFTLYKGNILDLRKDDVYYYDWNLYPYKEPPPPGLTLLTDTYGLRDVNYYPDFRDTLEKANAFVERSGDSTLTNGIAIHQGLIEDILAITGPVTLSGVSIPFDEKNFSLLMSTLVENQYAREHSPKDILFTFGETLAKKIHEKRVYTPVLDTLVASWKRGEIEIASRDTDMETFLDQYKKKLPWQTDAKNWAYPVFTSVSGNKSDRYIERTYGAQTKLLSGCTYENLITLTNTHTYTKKDADILTSYLDTLSITGAEERTKLSFIEGNGKNRAFVRLYVPRDSTLAFTGKDMTETTNEHAKVFSFLMETPPGGQTSKTIRYTTRIPDCQNAKTNLTWWRQPGLRSVTLE